ncbi:MAG TPA: serine protease [Bacteroidales bacterium]|nr:serine protease [Bacteroidales bacterium]
MKTNLFLFLCIGLLVHSTKTFAQKYRTLGQYKTYFIENSASLDEIEGIWTSFESFTVSINDYTDTESSNYTVAIIKEANGYSEYELKDEIYQPEKWTNKFTKINVNKWLYGYTCEHVNVSVDLEGKSEIFTISNNTFNYSLNMNTIFKGVNSNVTIKNTYAKTFPLESDIINQKKENEVKKSTGTGFAISSNGYIATCNHVIDDAATIKVKGIGGNFNKSYSAKVISTDANNDLAIIKIDDATFITLGTIPYTIKSTSSDPGSSIFILGYPLTATMGDEIKLTNGIVSAKSGFKGDITSYQITAAAQPGNSGGPLFDKNGNLIGVVNAKHVEAENATYAVKSSYLLNIIESLSTKPIMQTVNSLSGKVLTEQVKAIKNFVYIIEVE